jgi:hypothetical protein
MVGTSYARLDRIRWIARGEAPKENIFLFQQLGSKKFQAVKKLHDSVRCLE